jgi:hypothetical protein
VVPGGLTHTQKRKLQRVHAREKKDQESERQRDEFFNKLWLMVPLQQWRAKAVSEALKETRVEVVEERRSTDAEVLVETEENWSARPATPVGLVIKGSAQNQSDWSMEFRCKQKQKFQHLLIVVQRPQHLQMMRRRCWIMSHHQYERIWMLM